MPSLEEMRFGIEIEFDAPKNFQFDRLGQELFEAKLVKEPFLMGYHASHIDSLYHHQRGWRYEEEHTTTGAEVISPFILSTEETWNNVEKVINLIHSYGGHCKIRDSGLHVHVTDEYLGRDMFLWQNLFSFLVHYEDILFRLAANPARGKHRKNKHTQPLPITNGKDRHVLPYLMNYSKKHFYVNTHNVKLASRQSGRVEFKIWDATLDSELIELQTKITLAIIRLAADRGFAAEAPPARLGHYYANPEDFGSHILDEFLLNVFPLKSELDMRKQAEKLFYANSWVDAYKSNKLAA